MRDPKEATALLEAVAEEGDNQELTTAYAAFLALGPAMRISLLGSIKILDNKPLVTDLGEAIEKDLRLLAPRGQAAVARERLEGWLWPRVKFARSR